MALFLIIFLFLSVPLSHWSVSKLSSVTESEKAMPFSFPDSYIPTVTKIIIDINSGNKLLDHQLDASPREGKASKITHIMTTFSKVNTLNLATN